MSKAAPRSRCDSAIGRYLVGQLCQCSAHPPQILNQGSSTRLLLRRNAGPECQIADRASGVLEPDAIFIEASLDRRLVNAQQAPGLWAILPVTRAELGLRIRFQAATESKLNRRCRPGRGCNGRLVLDQLGRRQGAPQGS